MNHSAEFIAITQHTIHVDVEDNDELREVIYEVANGDSSETTVHEQVRPFVFIEDGGPDPDGPFMSSWSDRDPWTPQRLRQVATWLNNRADRIEAEGENR